MPAQSRIELPDTGFDDGSADSAVVKARQLLCEILPSQAREEFLSRGFFHHEGRIGLYRISRSSQTEIYRNGRLTACSCLQLTIPSPSYDRMIAEYLILKCDERLYWNTANVFPVRSEVFDPATLTVLVLDLALLLNLVLTYLI
jgi:hypothetical protein